MANLSAKYDMKKYILLIVIVLGSILSQAQTTSSTTTAATALKTFEDSFLTIDWSAKTTADQDAFNRQWTGLKIAVAKENETNRLAAVAAQTAHFREIGHTLESKVGGTDVLCKCVLHFN